MSEGGSTNAFEQNSRQNRGKSRMGILKTVIGPSILAFVVIYLLSGICVVKPEEQALVTRFGKLRPAPLRPGTHYRIPYPVDRVTRVKPSEVKSLMVGVPLMVDEGELEGLYYSTDGVGSEFLTGDENIIHVTLNVQYKIAEPAKYVFNSVSPELLVKIATEMALTDVVARTHVDDLLTSGKQWVLAQVKGRAQEELDLFKAGVGIISANFANVSPPSQVVDAFKDVASALEDRDRIINEATGNYNETIPRARGEAGAQIQEALADKTAKINRAKGEANRFLATLEEYRQSGNSEVSLLRLYIETMEEVLPGMKKYVVDTPGARDLDHE